MPTSTTNYGLSKPLVNDPTDQDLWGGELNADMDEIDTLMATAIKWVKSSQTANFSVTAPTSGSSTTGSSKKFFLCDATAGVITASLPAAASAGDGFTVAFKKTDSSANAITLTPNGSEKIDGASTFVLSAQYAFVVMVCDGSTWNIQSQSTIVAAPVVAYGSIFGLFPTGITGSSTTAALTVKAGQAADSTNMAYITLGTDKPWAVSNGNAINGFDGGTTLPANSDIYFYVCSGISGSGVFASTSLTPTFPTGYNAYSRGIFNLKTDGSGSLIPIRVVETEGSSITCYVIAQTLDVSVTNLGTSRTLYPLNIPGGRKMEAFIRASTTTTIPIIITSPDETDVAPTNNGVQAFTSAPGFDIQYQNNANVVASIPSYSSRALTTDTSGRIGARAGSSSATLYIDTIGWKDFRRA